MPTRWPERAAVHAALGEPVRLAIVDDLAVSDRSPKELAARFSVPTNLLAHHLDVLEDVGLIERFVSAGDRRRRYVRLVRAPLAGLGVATAPRRPAGEVLFVCSHNSARSQLAAALWTARTGGTATSAGTHPADRVHPGAIAAASPRRVGPEPRRRPACSRPTDRPTSWSRCATRRTRNSIPDPSWWHWSLPDPVEDGRAAAFDAVITELDDRIRAVAELRRGTIDEHTSRHQRLRPHRSAGRARAARAARSRTRARQRALRRRRRRRHTCWSSTPSTDASTAPSPSATVGWRSTAVAVGYSSIALARRRAVGGRRRRHRAGVLRQVPHRRAARAVLRSRGAQGDRRRPGEERPAC